MKLEEPNKQVTATSALDKEVYDGKEIISNQENNWSSWGSSWMNIVVDTVKKQSKEIVDVYKKDLTEFATVVQASSSIASHKVSEAVTNISTQASRFTSSIENTEEIEEAIYTAPKETDDGNGLIDNAFFYADKAEDFLEKVSVGITSGITSGISSLLVNPPLSVSPPETKSTKKLVFDRRTAAILLLRADAETYLADPFLSPNPQVVERYTEFVKKFDLTDYALKIAKIQEEDVNVKQLLKNIVPSQVSNEECWCRYFFNVSELDLTIQARNQLIKQVDQQQDGAEDFAWEDDSESETELQTLVKSVPTSPENKEKLPDEKESDQVIANVLKEAISSDMQRTKSPALEYELLQKSPSMDVDEVESVANNTEAHVVVKEEAGEVDGWDEWE